MNTINVIAALLFFFNTSAAAAPQPEVPLCEQYNNARFVVLGRVIRPDYVLMPPPPINDVRPPRRVEAVRVEVLESFGPPVSGEIVIPVPEPPNYNPYSQGPGKFDPPLETGATYLFFDNWKILPADRAPIAELRRLASMKSGTLQVTLSNFAASLGPGLESAFLGRVIASSYQEAPSAPFNGGDPAPPVQIEMLRVAVTESFWGDAAGEIWIAAPELYASADMPLSNEQRANAYRVQRFTPPLQTGETYLFRVVDGTFRVPHPVNFPSFVATLAIPKESAPLADLERVTHSPQAGHMTLTLKAKTPPYKSRVLEGTGVRFQFEDVAPNKYSLSVENAGLSFDGPSGPREVEVRAGGCAKIELKNPSRLPVPYNGRFGTY